MADFKDLSARFKQVKAKNEPEDGARPYDHNESLRLRGKMLGVLIRDARLNAARTIEDCARLLNVQPDVIQAWEFGEAVPTLPQLELLAYYLDVHVSHFWGSATLASDRAAKINTQQDYMDLRHRMIGALLRQAREDRGMSIDELAEAAHMDAETLAQYEIGELPIPMNELPVLSNLVDKNVNYFLETSSYIGELLKIRAEWQHFLELDDDVREFAANPLNIGFIKIAMTFSKMPADELRKAAEGMLEISM